MPGSRVYVGNIRDDVRERDVEKFFKGFGGLREITLKNGFGFVEFEDDRDAEDACHDLDGKDLLGGRVRVELARERGRGGDRFGGDRGGFRGRSPPRRGGNPPGRKTNYRIIVENLSSRTSWQDLKDYFRAAGEITYTNAHKPRQGEGLVEFAERRGMEYAMEKLDDTELNGRRLRLVEESKMGGGGGGGRGRSRSRSRSRSSVENGVSTARAEDAKQQDTKMSRSRSGSRGRDRNASGDRRDKGRSRSRSRSRD